MAYQKNIKIHGVFSPNVWIFAKYPIIWNELSKKNVNGFFFLSAFISSTRLNTPKMILLASSCKRKLNNRKQLVWFYLGGFACSSLIEIERNEWQANTFTSLLWRFVLYALPSAFTVEALIKLKRCWCCLYLNSHTNTDATRLRSVM